MSSLAVISSAQQEEEPQFDDPIDAELVINTEVSDSAQSASGSSWSAYFSSSSSSAQPGLVFSPIENNTNKQAEPWNVNDLFRHNFRIGTGESESEMEDLETDLRGILSFEESHKSEIYQSRARLLIQHFLALDSPRLTEQMKDFLLSDGILDIFVSFITRIQPSVARDFDWSQQLLSVNRGSRASSEEEELSRYSENAVSVLSGTNPWNVRLLDQKLRDIVVSAFDILHPDAVGSFHNLRNLFNNFLERSPTSLLDTFLSRLPQSTGFLTDSRQTLNYDEYQKPLIMRCVHFIADPFVSEIILNSLTKKFCSDSEEELLQKRRFHTLLEENFIGELMEIIFSGNPQGHEAVIVGVSDFILRWIEEASSVRHSDILLISLLDLKWTSKFLSLLAGECPSFQYEAVLNVLHALCCRAQVRLPRVVGVLGSLAEKDLMSNNNNNNQDSYLESFSNGFSKLLGGQVEQLCQLIIESDKGLMDQAGVKFSSFSIFVNILKVSLKNTQLLDRIPQVFFDTVINWFLEYKNHNIFHSLVYRIIHLVLLSGHKNIIKFAISKTHLIPLFTESFTKSAKSSGFRGFIILILNVIRLSGELSSPLDYVPQLLGSSNEWKQFWPTLKLETMRQVQANGVQQVEPHFAPPLKISAKLMPGLPNARSGPLGIHLGSAYASFLGFPLPNFDSDPSSPKLSSTAITPSKKKKKRRKSPKNNNGDVALAKVVDDEDDFLESSSDTMSPVKSREHDASSSGQIR